ncbi:MAG: 16S rRNA (guanine(966)-N(2))-methyltransferase RsmD [Oscillospiraceae bacterium]|jgi:16S rRNA (guanine966-N2)-methyltransferase
MRVITGRYRGRNLGTLSGYDTVRPTEQKVKESMFSAIQFSVPGARILDLFAGSGQLGIEALSRGAREAVFVDSSRDAAGVIRRNLASLGEEVPASVIVGDCLRYADRNPGKFDIIFLDPPYGEGLAEILADRLHRMLADGGIAVCETGGDEEMPESPAGLRLRKRYRHGRTSVWIYDREEDSGT